MLQNAKSSSEEYLPYTVEQNSSSCSGKHRRQGWGCVWILTRDVGSLCLCDCRCLSAFLCNSVMFFSLQFLYFFIVVSICLYSFNLSFVSWPLDIYIYIFFYYISIYVYSFCIFPMSWVFILSPYDHTWNAWSRISSQHIEFLFQSVALYSTRAREDME